MSKYIIIIIIKINMYILFYLPGLSDFNPRPCYVCMANSFITVLSNLLKSVTIIITEIHKLRLYLFTCFGFISGNSSKNWITGLVTVYAFTRIMNKHTSSFCSNYLISIYIYNYLLDCVSRKKHNDKFNVSIINSSDELCNIH